MKDSVDNIERFMKSHGIGFWCNDKMFRLISVAWYKSKPIVYIGEVVAGEIDLTNMPTKYFPVPAWLTHDFGKDFLE